MTSSISRRSVAIGAAWTVPTITVAAAAPAFAASPRSIKVDVGPTGGKWTDNAGDGYIAQGVVITLTNSTGQSTISGAQLTIKVKDDNWQRPLANNYDTFWFVPDPKISSTVAQQRANQLQSVTLTTDANGQIRLNDGSASGYLRHGSDGRPVGTVFEVIQGGVIIGTFMLYNTSTGANRGTDPGVRPTAG